MTGRGTAFLAALAALTALVGVADAQLPPAEGLRCIAWDASGSRQVTIRGICSGWKFWRSADGATVTLVCPGVVPPPESVELRPYWVLSR